MNFIFLSLSLFLPIAAEGLGLAHSSIRPSIYRNPVIPGWNSDPSCTFVAEHNSTFFCTTSSFSVFPGIPIYASKDLVNWRLASNGLNRATQILALQNSTGPEEGIYASTLRYRNGTFFLVTLFVAPTVGSYESLVFTTTDPYDDNAWSDPIIFPTIGWDPDLFWDDDDQAYISVSAAQYAGIVQYPIDLMTGATGPAYSIWNGTGGLSPESPHVYQKEGYYYLMIAEGGTGLGHMETIARAPSVSGPYTAYERNPILTNRNTTQYFQTVGHADIFQDANSNWWGISLATRSGPTYVNYPMGRETCLYPVIWEKGDWPRLSPVRGIMATSLLPPRDKHIPGTGQFVNDADDYTFPLGSALPSHFTHWKVLNTACYTISPDSHPDTLRLTTSQTNLTGSDPSTSTEARTLIMRRQSHTLFSYSVDLQFVPRRLEEEAGITLFLNQNQHVDIGLVLLGNSADIANATLSVRFRTTAISKDELPVPQSVIYPVPDTWSREHIRLQIKAVNDKYYSFGVVDGADHTHSLVLGHAPGTIVSGGTGSFTGKMFSIFIYPQR